MEKDQQGQIPESPSPLKDKEEVHNNPDPKIDMDYPGFPHGQATENIIKPKNPVDEKTAALTITDGEKIDQGSNGIKEGDGDASGGAFEATEEVKE